MSEKVKTEGKHIAYFILSLLIILISLPQLTNFFGILALIFGLLIFPPIMKKISTKFGIFNSKWTKIALTLAGFIFFFISASSGLQNNSVPSGDKELGITDFNGAQGIGVWPVKAPDTENMLFTYNGTLSHGDCSAAKDLSEYGVTLSKDCERVWSTDVSNYCELGNEKGEFVKYYYCSPMRFIKCKSVSSSGEVEDVKYYGTTKVLNCSNSNEQLIGILVKSCSVSELGTFDCS
jgi:hypothetical protein